MLKILSILYKFRFQSGGIIKNSTLNLFGQYGIHDLWFPLSLLEDLING